MIKCFLKVQLYSMPSTKNKLSCERKLCGRLWAGHTGLERSLPRTHASSLTLSILFSIKLSKTWMASMFMPLYTMALFVKAVSFSAVLSPGSSSGVVASWAVSSWVNGQMRTSKQETGTLLKRLTALLKGNLKLQYFSMTEWAFKM